ncbi:hypothetical protein C1T17_03710 [Sphingobium sp. SCG-1]|uniref:hypothetical protein n=1 Tax=Sphingobium sp. SCG-1 TaxID=2072936 RepID=UPI000CD6A064|nr:hypothetical protein [Sphingobium sp. SCG-1]AUW57333.1 hypothetical protein C1T17_03710 [Sphingobium sp. SCG-1]
MMLAAAAPQATPAPASPPAAPAPIAPAASPPYSANAAPDLGYLSAGALVDRCSENSPASTSYCFAYIAGVSDAMRAYEIWLNTREFCPPRGNRKATCARLSWVSSPPIRAIVQDRQHPSSS